MATAGPMATPTDADILTSDAVAFTCLSGGTVLPIRTGWNGRLKAAP